MTKINSVNSARINTLNVNKNNVVSNINKVDKVNKVTPTTNNGNGENFTISSTYFYDKLKDSKKDYEKFNLKQEELHKKNDQSKKEPKKIITNDYTQLLDTIKNLITKYNISIAQIQKLDIYTGKYHVKRISNILLENQDILSYIGITLNNIYLLQLNEEKFKLNIHESIDKVNSFFDLDNGFIKKIYNEFKIIKNTILKERESAKGALFNEKY